MKRIERTDFMFRIMDCKFVLFLFAAITFTFHLSPVAYAWQQNGTPICTNMSTQYNPTITDDGLDGAIIAWSDYRSGNYDIYAQRVDSNGDAQWTVNGKAICTNTSYQFAPAIMSDGSGGAIIVWYDDRNGNYDIYAQRVDFNGDAQWTVNGKAICTNTSTQYVPVITSDGSGGAIIAWEDNRNGNSDIYAQRINLNGDVQWGAGDRAICTNTKLQMAPTITSDGSSGAIITWYDERNNNDDIYAQRVNSNGVVQWDTDGKPVCVYALVQDYPAIVGDGSGGAIITWEDIRNGNNYDIYAQQINLNGDVQWGAGGRAICTNSEDQYSPMVTSDGLGGAIIAWGDYRNNDWNIYSQRVNSNGDAQWRVDGRPICTNTGEQNYPTIASVSDGIVIITWMDYRNNNWDVYASKTSRTGSTYKTKVGNAASWRWDNAFVGDNVQSGINGATDWRWQGWVSGSGRKVPQGDASGWSWGAE